MDAADIGAAMAQRLRVPQSLVLADRALLMGRSGRSERATELHGASAASASPHPAGSPVPAGRGVDVRLKAVEAAEASSAEINGADGLPRRIAIGRRPVAKVQLLGATSSTIELGPDAVGTRRQFPGASGTGFPRHAQQAGPKAESTFQAAPAQQPAKVIAASPRSKPQFSGHSDYSAVQDRVPPQREPGQTRGTMDRDINRPPSSRGGLGPSGALMTSVTNRAARLLQQSDPTTGSRDTQPYPSAPVQMAWAPPLSAPVPAMAPRVADQQNVPAQNGGAAASTLTHDASTEGNQADSNSGNTGPTQGDVYLDGTLMGRWVMRALAAEAARPASGNAAFDPRRAMFPSGAMIGG